MTPKEQYETRKAHRRSLREAAEILEDHPRLDELAVEEAIDRIATALERIADSLERKMKS